MQRTLNQTARRDSLMQLLLGLVFGTALGAIMALILHFGR